MYKLVFILLIGLMCEAVGVVFLSKGLNRGDQPMEFSGAIVKEVLVRAVTSPHVWIGVFFEALFFLSLLILMSRGDVSFIWPLTALGFVLTTLAAKLFLGEHVSMVRWCGVVLIMAGAFLISWSEKEKELLSTVDPEYVRALGAGETDEGAKRRVNGD